MGLSAPVLDAGPFVGLPYHSRSPACGHPSWLQVAVLLFNGVAPYIIRRRAENH